MLLVGVVDIHAISGWVGILVGVVDIHAISRCGGYTCY